MHKQITHVKPHSSAPPRKPAEEILAALISQRHPNAQRPILIAVGGPGGTGKSTFSARLEALFPGQAATLRLDDYKTPRALRQGKNLFGAHPEANDMARLRRHLELAKKNKPFDKPLYNTVTGRADTTQRFDPKPYIILDGEIATYANFRDLVDFSIFIDADWKTQLATRTSRDIEQRGYTWEKAIATFLQSNLREFTKYGAESKLWADIHLYCREDYRLTIESVSEEIFQRHASAFASDLDPVDFSGLVVPTLTPFSDDNQVDRRAFIDHLEHLATRGVRRVLVNGTTAEFFSLAPAERKLILELAREYFPGVVFFHAGADSLAQTTEQARWAEDFGADAVLALPPYYYAHAPARGIVEYFNTLGSRLDIPLIIYNFPLHTQNPLTPEILAGIEHFGMKDSSADLNLLPATPRYYLGGDPLLVEAHKRGAYGFVSAQANHAPDLYVAIERALALEDPASEESARLQSEINALRDRMAAGPGGGIWKMKHLVAQNVPNYPTRVRPPLVEGNK